AHATQPRASSLLNFFVLLRRPPTPTLFPYTTLFRSILADATNLGLGRMAESSRGLTLPRLRWTAEWHVRDETYLSALAAIVDCRSEEHTSELQSRRDLVCRLLLEKKKSIRTLPFCIE